MEEAPINTIERPSKRRSQLLQQPKRISKRSSSLPLLNGEQAETPMNKLAELAQDCSCSVSKIVKEPKNDFVQNTNKLQHSKVEPTEGMSEQFKLDQKRQTPVKPRLYPVPADQGISEKLSNFPTAQDDSHLAESNCSTMKPIPAPRILLPIRLESRFELNSNNGPTNIQTRSIGIQVDLQPMGDMTIM
jgi:hypothetical protein